MNVSDAEAKRLVEDFLAKQDLKGYRYEFVRVNFNNKYPDEYGAVFNVYSPEGSLIDGPAVFIVNKNSRKVRIL